MTSSPGVARRARVSRTLMRSGDKEVASAAVCQGPAARASMDKKTPKKNRHSESVYFVCGGGGVLHFYHHFPKVKFLRFKRGGGGYTFIIRNGGGGSILSPVLNVFRGSIFSHFPLARYSDIGAMRQRKLGSHTPPCHKRMVITTLFSVLLAALQRRPVLFHTRLCIGSAPLNSEVSSHPPPTHSAG